MDLDIALVAISGDCNFLCRLFRAPRGVSKFINYMLNQRIAVNVLACRKWKQEPRKCGLRDDEFA